MIIDENQKKLLFIIVQLLKQAGSRGEAEEILRLANGENYLIKVTSWKND